MRLATKNSVPMKIPSRTVLTTFWAYGAEAADLLSVAELRRIAIWSANAESNSPNPTTRNAARSPDM